MTVADDLATLYEAARLAGIASRMDAVKRVEAEIARLERERDTARKQIGVVKTHMDGRTEHLRERAEAAESEVARLRDGLRLLPQKWQDVVLAEDGPR